MKVRTLSQLRSLPGNWENQPTLIWAVSILGLLLVGGLAFGWQLGSTGLIDETEPLFAEAARLMTVTGDWVTPYFNGETRFDKPPLVYWLMAIAYHLLGVNTWAVRLPSALAAFGMMVLGFLTLRQFGITVTPGDRPSSMLESDRQRWQSAWIGTLILALTPLSLAWSRIGVSDMLLNGCMGFALLAFFWGYAQPIGSPVKLRWYLAFYILSALAVLTKGPVGIVLPILIIGTFLLYLGKFREVLQEMQLLWGSLLFLLIAVPWYILVIRANGEAFIDSFFGYHNLERFTEVVNQHSAPWFFYFIVVMAGFAPWSFHLPVAIARLRFWRRADWQQQPRTAHLGLFALTWFAVIFSFFTIAATKLPSYVIPLMPAAAILVGLFWSDQMTQRQASRSVVISSILSLIFVGAIAIFTLYSPQLSGGDPAMPDLPQLLQQSGILIWGTTIWSTALIVGISLLLRRKGHWLWLPYFLAMVLYILLAVMPATTLVDAQRQLPLRQLAATIVQTQQPGEEIIMFGMKKPSLSFYTEKPITYLSTIKQTTNHLRRRTRHKTEPPSVLIVAYAYKIPQLELKPNQYQVLDQKGAYELIRVK
jgi:4-amino-4-deoxy-L-arabinose transferase-like glycosyltransferase